MTLLNIASDLLEQFEQEKNAISSEPLTELQKHTRISQTITVAISQLNASIKEACFANEAEEILFFKDTLPEFYATLQLHKDCYIIECNKPISTPQAVRRYFARQYRIAEHAIEQERGFYLYWRTGSTQLDTLYFTRKGSAILSAIEALPPGFDPELATPYCLKLARILGQEYLKEFLLNEVEHVAASSGSFTAGISLQWTGPKLGLTELIYAWHEMGCFNHGKITLKQLVDAIEMKFSIKLGNYSRNWQAVLNRKKDYTAFLTELREAGECRAKKTL